MVNLHHKRPASRKFPNGFTLIEMLVTIGILAILVGSGVVLYRDFAHRQQAEMVALELHQMVKATQLRARFKETPSGCTGGLQRQRIWLSGGIVSVSAICTSSTVTLAQRAFTIPSGITISPSSFDYSFLTLNGGVRDGSTLLTGSQSRTIEVSRGSYTYEFTITAGGSISEPRRTN